ncbi:MAG: hypothetical protein HRU09_11685 [Oligoflexales bacterium]|nr:hypothetical protein [Oligoflexales bacterium]
MKPHIRQSLAAKIVAVGFIILILLGNFWVVGHLLGRQPSEWMSVLGLGGLALVLIGGVFLMIQIVTDHFDAN